MKNTHLRIHKKTSYLSVISVGIFLVVLLIGIYFLGVYRQKFSEPPSQKPQTAEERRRLFHYPVRANSYLTLPFRKKDLIANPLSPNQLYNVSQGWLYSAEELAIHGGSELHAAVDFHVPYGTEVVAPADGYVLSSYDTQAVSEDGKPKLYKGKPIWLGFGYYVEMYIPSENRFIELAHLSDIDAAVPFVPSVRIDSTNWESPLKKLFTEEFTRHPATIFVKKGTVIGKVGYSGLTWGYEEYKEGAKRPIVINPQEKVSWDIPHLHFVEFGMDSNTKIKGWQRDPYGVYDTYNHYPNEVNNDRKVHDPLFFMTPENLPQFADE